MKNIILLSVLINGLGFLLFSSCKKEKLCENCLDGNKPPVAIAGNDTSIVLPVDIVTLDGSKSADPDNNITSYIWTKISGPSSYNISNFSYPQTKVLNLLKGEYQFELKVTDAGGLFSKDTLKVFVVDDDVITDCSNRPVINAFLIPIGLLSMKSTGLVSASAGNKILFAGGRRENGNSKRVDIYDIATNVWSTAELSQEDREGMVAASVGNKIFFAGGANYDNGPVTSRVDIYDVSDNTWSTAELSKARSELSAATFGNKIFFAGGASWEPFFIGSNVVDIYDNSTNTWTTATLSEGRQGLSATTVGNKIYFAGGSRGPGALGVSTKIDIYDGETNSWSSSNLLEARTNMASIAVDNKIFWGGGINAAWSSGQSYSNQVEIKNMLTGVSSFSCMIPRAYFQSVIKGDNIIFFTGFASNIDAGTNHFEIYNTTTDTWKTGILNLNLNSASIISVNNTIYVAGGNLNQNGTNQVWKLEF